MSDSLYVRLGGYDAVASVADNLLPRLIGDDQLGRFWAHRGDDGIQREKQLLINFLCNAAGGPVVYTGRDMKATHAGMRLSDSDWSIFIDHLKATLDSFSLPDQERNDVLGFIESLKGDIVEC
jgi:hemoglobin